MHVLVVSSKYPPEYSGSGLRIHRLYKRLSRGIPQLNVDLIAGSVEKNDCCEYDFEGTRVHRFAGKLYRSVGLGLMKRYQNARNCLAETKLVMPFLTNSCHNIDLIHIVGKNYITAAVADFGRRHGIPVVIELCNEMETPFQYVPLLARHRLSQNLPDKYHFVCISKRLQSVCLKNGIPQDRIWCRPNPIDEDCFCLVEKVQRMALRKQLTRFDEASKVLVSIGKFTPAKNHIFLLDVLSKLPAEYKLVMVGPIVQGGPLALRDEQVLTALRHRCTELGLDGRTEIKIGFVENAAEYYQLADVFVQPSIEEGFGTTVLESIACGTPVVAHRITGTTEDWVNDGQSGFLCDLDAVQFARRIIDASEIPLMSMQAASENIIAAAGTRVIDEEYRQLFERMSVA